MTDLRLAQLAQLFAMPSSPSSSSNDSRETTPAAPHMLFDLPKVSTTTKVQTSPFLKLPVDLFKCVTDYLDRNDAWALKRLCRGMSKSKVIDELLYRYPLQLEDVKDIRLGDWKYKSMGQARWNSFQKCINDSNRRYVQKLAISHWASIADFKWIEEHLPAVISLDVSAIKDFVWTPEETWTWKELASACPVLFGRLGELTVSNWADYTAHSRIEYMYGYSDYRFKPTFRISRRREKDGGSVAKMIFPICTNLKTLGIRAKDSCFHTWNEWEVHQRVCCLLDGISRYCPPNMTKLRVHDYAPYRALFSTDALSWSKLSEVEIDLYSWMQERGDREFMGPIPYRITVGIHHRDEEEAFDDATFHDCKRDHMDLGQPVVRGINASFEDLLQSLRTITVKYPHIKIKPMNTLRDATIQPFHLVNVTNRRGFSPAGPLHPSAQPPADPVANQEIQEALRWLSKHCDWKPIFAWDNLLCDVFPANLEATRSFLPKQEVVARIRSMFSTLRSLDIPIRLSIGDMANTCPSSGLDGSLYFGDYKTFVGEGDNRQEIMAPTQACFNLTGIAPMVDELTIQYPVDVPGVHGWLRAGKRPTDAEKVLLQREMAGWRRFWARYALQFKNLKKLTANVPNSIYEDWGRCEGFRELLSDERWQMLEVEEDVGIISGCWPFVTFRYNFSRKRPRIKFVQRVFFRQDQAPLHITVKDEGLSDEQREQMEIPDDVIADKEGLGEHRFWPQRQEKDKKRKGEGEEASGDDHSEGRSSKKAKKED